MENKIEEAMDILFTLDCTGVSLALFTVKRFIIKLAVFIMIFLLFSTLASRLASAAGPMYGMLNNSHAARRILLTGAEVVRFDVSELLRTEFLLS